MDSAYGNLLAFPDNPSRSAGFQLGKVQVGLDPDDWKPFDEVGVGIDHFTRTRNNFNGYSTPSFWVHRTNGTATDFSYISGVNGQPK